MTLVRDLAILVARVGIGAIFIAHGWQKLVTNGVDGTAGFFGSVGIPAPTAAAWFAALVEVGGGVALILGLLTPVVGVLLALNMLGAYVFVHAGKGLFVDQGGAELVLALGVGALLIAAVGAGRLSVDALLTPVLRRSPATATATA